MITQIKYIKHFGQFDTVSNAMPNNGKLKRINLLYAPNGSGKTTLSLMMQSLATDNNQLILKKRDRLGARNVDPEICLKIDENEINFCNEKWKKKLPNRIKIFNSYFIGKNVYIFDIEENGFELSEIVDNSKVLKKLINTLNQKSKKLTKLRHYRKALRANNATKKLQVVVEQIAKLQYEIEALSTQYKEVVTPFYEIIISKTNEILKEFQANFRVKLDKSVLELLKIAGQYKVSSKIIFDIYSNDFKHLLLSRSKDQDRGVDYILSDGDKSSLTFALYTSLLMLNKNLQKQIVFIDDPFTSMDSDRRYKTIIYLTHIAQNCEQLIITSHDKYFLSDLQKQMVNFNQGYLANDILRLELKRRNHGKSQIVEGNFQSDSLYNLSTIKIFKSFIEEQGDYNHVQLMSIGRSIRPFLEDAFKYKFPDFYVPNQTWLKVYLDYIKKSKDDSKYRVFSRLYKNISILQEILSYTQSFNHSENYMQKEINEFELRNIIEHTMELFRAI